MKRETGLLLLALVVLLGAAARKTVLSLAQMRELARKVGFPDPNLAAAVAMAESGGKAGIVVPEPRGGPSYGLWQIHQSAHPEFNPTSLLDPDYNARAALAISKRGTDWSAWSAFNNGSYKKYLGAAA